MAQRIDEPTAGRRRVAVELVDAGVADAPLGHVEDPLDAHLVGGVDDGAEVRHRVADLPAVVVTRAADHLVRHTAAHQRLLDDAALGVGAVEHGDLSPVDGVRVAQLVGSGGDEAGLVVLVLGPVADDPVAAPDVGPQVLGLAVDVVGDHGVGGVEDRLRAAVVLVEDDRRDTIRKGVLELHDVAQVGTPEAVDRLVAVADHGDVAVAAGEQQDELVLGDVGVLVLVDEHVLEALAVGLEDVRVLAEQGDGVDEQVVEVHRPGGVQPALVLGVHLGVLAVEDVLGAVRRRRRGRRARSSRG